ncbi:MAG: insulinase family protein, partial [Candidatus Cryptobacteroides sp.]
TVVEVFNAYLDEYRLIDEVALSAATYILDMRYVKSLREDEGGTYGASAYGVINPLPKPAAMLQVAFETSPTAADRLVELSLRDLNALTNEGPTAEEFDMAKKNLQKNIPESRITNGHWLNVLRSLELFGLDYDQDYEEVVNNLKPEDLQNILGKIINSGTAKTMIMRPGATAEAE